MSIANTRLRHTLHAVTKRLPFWFNTCKWLCQPLKRTVCIYPPGCSAPFVMDELRTRLEESGILNCKHENRRPNPKATSIKPPMIAEICNDCGTGITSFGPRNETGEIR